MYTTKIDKKNPYLHWLMYRFVVQWICQGNLNIMKRKYLTPHVEYLPKCFWVALNLLKVNWVLFFCIDYYITSVKSKAINKRIISIKEKIKKSFLDTLSASFQSEVGKHPTVKYFQKYYTKHLFCIQVFLRN